MRWSVHVVGGALYGGFTFPRTLEEVLDLWGHSSNGEARPPLHPLIQAAVENLPLKLDGRSLNNRRRQVPSLFE